MPNVSSPVELVGEPLSERERAVRWSAWGCVAVYLVVVVGVFAGILHANGGHFVYSLDDPYIHLALAENIAHGHYGINASEPSSPSSTLLWPLMVVPLAGTAWHEFVPLFWNLVFGVASGFAIGGAMARWMPLRGERDWLGRLKQIGMGALLMVVGNLVGLAFLGMEHTLQVFLAILCALGCAEAWDGRPVPAWSLAAAVVAPSVRYEDVILTLAVCLALAGRHERKKAVVVMAASLAPLALFGLFLKAHGLPGLPTSVMVKGNVYADDSGFFGSLMQMAVNNISQMWGAVYLKRPMTVMLGIFTLLLVKERVARRRYVLVAAVLAAALQIAFGRFGWFYRYEVYALIFLAVVLVRIATESRPIWLGVATLVLLWMGTYYINAIPETVQSSHEVYGQQYQMHRFVDDYWRQDVAVNDLGWVSFQKPAGIYVLDVYGLASVEASQQSDKTEEWLEGIVKRHGVRLAMVYPGWFDIPDSWVPEGRMCLDRKPIIVASQCMEFYSTAPESEQVIKEELHLFAPTLPAFVTMYFLPEQEGEGPP
jgi:hypothetical protein